MIPGTPLLVRYALKRICSVLTSVSIVLTGLVRFLCAFLPVSPFLDFHAAGWFLPDLSFFSFRLSQALFHCCCAHQSLGVVLGVGDLSSWASCLWTSLEISSCLVWVVCWPCILLLFLLPCACLEIALHLSLMYWYAGWLSCFLAACLEGPE